jgi:hypothetical protein
MLQMNTAGAITEYIQTDESMASTISVGSTYFDSYHWPYQTVYWNSYPVYVCTDKTKKAIEVLKALQAEKLLKCDSVPRFIALVEKSSNLL